MTNSGDITNLIIVFAVVGVIVAIVREIIEHYESKHQTCLNSEVKQHQLKLSYKYFPYVESGDKTFELRDTSDRDFNVGDILILKEVDEFANYTGREVKRKITYILKGPCYGLLENYAILGMKEL